MTEPTRESMEKAKNIFDSTWNGTNFLPKDVINTFALALQQAHERPDLEARIVKLESAVKMAREALEPLIGTAKTYAIQTYDRSGCTRKQWEFAGQLLTELAKLEGK